MMPAQWVNKIKQLPNQIHGKVSAQGEPLPLSYIDRSSVIEFVSKWLQKYYDRENLIPPQPLYPFKEQQLLDLADDKPTVRELLKWCQGNCVPLPPQDPVEEAFKIELDIDWENDIDDNYRLADALYYGFITLIGKTVEKVTVTAITNRVFENRRKDPYLNLKIVGDEGGKDVRIGLAVLQYESGRTLGAAFRRLMDYEKFSLTCGCLVRTRDKKVSHYIEKTYLTPLIQEQGGEFVELKKEEIKPLLAIRAVHQKREDYQVTEEQILDYIERERENVLLGENNPLLQEILSDPSYEVPSLLIEDEVEMEDTALESTEIDSKESLDDLLSE